MLRSALYEAGNNLSLTGFQQQLRGSEFSCGKVLIMKSVLTSLSILLALSTLAAAAPPPAETAPAETAAAAPAPSAEDLALARRFIATAYPNETMMDGVRQGFWQGASRQLDKIEDEAARSKAEARIAKMLEQIEPEVRDQFPAVMEAYAHVYAREFSAEELEQLIAFAGSPAGKHYLQKATLLEGDPSLIEAQQQLMMAITPHLEEFGKQLCQEKAAERLAAGETSAKCPLSGEPETASS